MTPDQIVRPRTFGEPFKHELNGDASTAKDGLAKHDARHPLDKWLPIHRWIVSHDTPSSQCQRHRDGQDAE